MRYQDSLARDMARPQWETEADERRQERQGRRASFEVVAGEGLDARARAGASPAFLRAVATACAAVVVLLVLGVARVALSTQAMSMLQSNARVQAQIDQVAQDNDTLRLERTKLSDAGRLRALATGYGMVSADSTEAVTLGSAASGAADPSAQDPSAQDSSGAASTAAGSQGASSSGTAQLD